MKKVMMLAMLLVAANVATNVATATDVTAFIDQVKAVNPVDRWMPSGSIEYTIEQVRIPTTEQPTSVTTHGTLDYNADHARFERHRVSGAFTIPDSKDREKQRVPEDLIVYTSPGTKIISIPSIAMADAVTDKSDPVLQHEMIEEGVLTAEVVLRLDKATRIGSGNKFDYSDGGTLKSIASFDDQGRMIERSVSGTGRTLQYVFSDHIRLSNGKYAPQSITTRRSDPKGEMVRIYNLQYAEGTPNNASVFAGVPKVSPKTPCPNSDLLGPMGIKTGDFLNPIRPISLARLGWICWHTDSLYPTYTVVCCDDQETCPVLVEVTYLNHCHCVYVGNPYFQCTSLNSRPVQVVAECYWRENYQRDVCKTVWPGDEDHWNCWPGDQYYVVEDNVCDWQWTSGLYACCSDMPEPCN